LFGTTEEFLKRFGLVDLSDLPNNEQLLERIKTIYLDEEKSETLFNNYVIEEEKIEEKLSKKVEEEKEGLSIDEIDAKIKKALENINFKLPEEKIPDFLNSESNLAKVE